VLGEESKRDGWIEVCWRELKDFKRDSQTGVGIGVAQGLQAEEYTPLLSLSHDHIHAQGPQT
jgi:hypothetical protein